MKKTIQVYFANRDFLITEINGTKKQIEEYYLGENHLGKLFNLGSGGNDLMVRAVKVEFLDWIIYFSTFRLHL